MFLSLPGMPQLDGDGGSSIAGGTEEDETTTPVMRELQYYTSYFLLLLDLLRKTTKGDNFSPTLHEYGRKLQDLEAARGTQSMALDLNVSLEGQHSFANFTKIISWVREELSGEWRNFTCHKLAILDHVITAVPPEWLKVDIHIMCECYLPLLPKVEGGHGTRGAQRQVGLREELNALKDKFLDANFDNRSLSGFVDSRSIRKVIEDHALLNDPRLLQVEVSKSREGTGAEQTYDNVASQGKTSSPTSPSKEVPNVNDKSLFGTGLSEITGPSPAKKRRTHEDDAITDEDGDETETGANESRTEEQPLLGHKVHVAPPPPLTEKPTATPVLKGKVLEVMSFNFKAEGLVAR